MWAEAIAETRARFDARRLAAWGRWGVTAPAWGADDASTRTYAHHERLFREGRVVWARVVKAHRHIYGDECRDPHAGVVILALDAGLDATPEVLDEMGTACRALRDGELPEDPALREFALVLRDDMDRAMSRPLPPGFGPREGVITLGTVFHREHLPGGVLSGLAVVPLLVEPETEASLVVPREYWSAGALRLYRQARLPL